MKKYMKISAGLLALAIWLPGMALAADHHSSTDTGADVLDYIENERRLARENKLDDDQKQLLTDTQDMKAHLRQPIDPKQPLPVAFEGDDLFYDENTGEVYAKGNVKITQIDAHRFTSDEADGNLKTHDIEVAGKAHMLQLTDGMQRIKLDGYKTEYNYATQIGKMENVSGKVDHQYIKAARVELYPDKTILYDGTATKCSAKNPDYHVSAKKMEIYPNDKMVMYDVDYWLGSMKIYHKKKVEQDLKNKDEGPQYPSLTYNNDDGMGIAQNYRRDIAPNVNAYMDLLYMTKWGIRNLYGVNWSHAGSRLGLKYGYEEDDNNHWIRKQPSLTYDYDKHFNTMPFSYGFSYETGYWYNDGVHSTHTEYDFRLSHDPIVFSNWYLYLGTSYSITHETGNDSDVRGFNWSATAVKSFDDRFAAYAGYYYSATNSKNTLFKYNQDDYSRKFEAGISYRLTDKDRIVIGQNYDLSADELKDVDYYWYHDIHCAQLILRYREKRHSINLGLELIPW